MSPNAASLKSQAAEPVLNHTVIEQYAKRKTNLLERLVTAYLEEAPTFHSCIRKGFEGDDHEAVRQGAHALKSSSHNMGALRLAKLCQELESSAGAGDRARVETLLGRLGPECFDAEEALRSALLRHTGKTIASAPPVVTASPSAAI